MNLYDEMVERIVLGTFITHEDVQGDGFEVLSPEDFFVPKHRDLFAACVSMDAAGEIVTSETVGSWLSKSGQLPLQLTLINCLGETALPNSFKTNARVVREFAVRRDAVRTANALKAQAENMSEDVFAALTRADERLMELGGVMKTSKPEPLGGVLSEVMEKIEEIRNGTRKTFGLTTGNPELDSAIGGFRPGKLIVVAGRPSQGKSAAVASMLRAASREGGVAVFSLEMGKEELSMRLLSQESRVSFFRIEHAKLQSEHLVAVSKAVTSLSSRNFIIDDVGSLTLPMFRARVKEMVAQGVKVVAVDYLQLMDAPDADTRDQSIGKITRVMKNMTKDYGITIIAVSQLNRQVDSREDKRPTLGDLRESGNIEQDADVVIFVLRPETYRTLDDGSDLNGKAFLIMGKNRNGISGNDIETYFDKETMDFRPISPRIPEETF
jgi:replicative DNA helicase